jgi:linoleoyl-CoA desaturase
VRGRDRDLGYGALRLFPEQPWHPGFLFQPLIALGLAASFEWGVALHDVELDRVLTGKKSVKRAAVDLAAVARKATRKLLKDYVVFPVLAGPSFAPVLLGNLAANFGRNLWTFGIIFCGHFTGGVETFPEAILEGETRGRWYMRQLRGSGNLEGGPLFHVLTGNLSHQIEHHLFPDLPAHRYAELASDVKRIAAKYGQPYETGPFHTQFRTVLGRILRHSLPSRRISSPKDASPSRSIVPRKLAPASALGELRVG